MDSGLADVLRFAADRLAAVTAERDALKKAISEGTRLDYVVRSYEAMASALIAERDTVIAKLMEITIEAGKLDELERSILDMSHPNIAMLLNDKRDALAKLAKCREALERLEEVGILCQRAEESRYADARIFARQTLEETK
jgi:hypothetical protein